MLIQYQIRGNLKRVFLFVLRTKKTLYFITMTNTTTTPAFALSSTVTSSTFTNSKVGASFASCPLSVRDVPVSVQGSTRRVSVSPIVSEFQYNAPQPGDAGYKPPPPVPKGTGMVKTEEDKPVKTVEATSTKVDISPAAAKGKKLPVISNATNKVKRGLDLLREDVLKNAPTRVGVGRQDQSAVMKPMYGEPGYKPAAYETVKVSDLGISPFPDDANAVGNVGGIAAVKKAAVEVQKGEKTAAEIKREVLKIETKKEAKVFDIPDYLKPLPEDTTRKGFTWKNYVGR